MHAFLQLLVLLFGYARATNWQQQSSFSTRPLLNNNNNNQQDQQNTDSTTITGACLPPSMASITIPHTFSEDEIDSLTARMRAFSLELQMFSISSQYMSSDQRQQNYQAAIWPMMMCLFDPNTK